jgi:RNA polymerase-binding transcription factor DksA
MNGGELDPGRTEPSGSGSGGSRPEVAHAAGAVDGRETAEIEPAAVAVIERAAETLELVDAALGRLIDGSYGTCRACGARIDPVRRSGDPLLLECPTCASAPPRETEPSGG